jgi:hypothetical protein
MIKVGTKEELLAATELSPTWGEYMGASVREGFEHTSTDMLLTEQRVRKAENKAYGDQSPSYQSEIMADSFGGVAPRQGGTSPAFIAKEDWNEKHEYFRKGIEWREGMTPERAQVYAEDYDKREWRRELLARGGEKYGFLAGTVPGFFASMLGNLPDPVNLIPFGSGLRMKTATAAASRATGRAAVMAGVKAGAVEGFVSNLAVDLLVLPSLKSRGDDITFADYALDGVFGAALGGLLGGFGGFFRGYNVMLSDSEASIPTPFDSSPDRFLADMAERQKGGKMDSSPSAQNDFDDFSPTDIARQNMHGEPRQALLNAFELAVDDVANGRPVDVSPVLRESAALGKAWDIVRKEIDARTPAGEPGEILVLLEPEGLDPMGVQRGPMAEVNGKMRASGRAAEHQTGSRAGYGLTKVQIDHPDVTRADVMSIPFIMREYAAILPEGMHSGRTWIVEREDGRQLVIGETVTDDGGMLATVHLAEPEKERPLSQRKGPENSLEGSASQQFAAVLTDTGGGFRTGRARSPQGEVRIVRDGEEVKPLVPDFSTERPEVFTPAPPSNEVRSVYDELGADPKTGRTIEELQASEQAERGAGDPESFPYCFKKYFYVIIIRYMRVKFWGKYSGLYLEIVLISVFLLFLCLS